MKTMQFFVNIFTVSVAAVIGARAFANLIETEKPYNADAFFTGILVFWGVLAVALIYFAARAFYGTDDYFLKRWLKAVMLGSTTSIVALIVVMSWMLGIAPGLIVSFIGFGAFGLIVREARDIITGYQKGQELYFVPPVVFTALGTLAMSYMVDDHPLVAFIVMSALMAFASATTLWFRAGYITVPEEAVGVSVMGSPASAPRRESDAPGQLVDKRV